MHFILRRLQFSLEKLVLVLFLGLGTQGTRPCS